MIDVQGAIEAADRKVKSLESCALKRSPHISNLPPFKPSRDFRNIRALYNAVDSTVLRLEKIATSLPRVAVEGRSHIQAALIDYDPGELFFKLIKPPLALVLDAAMKISMLTKDFGEAAGVVLQQAELLKECVRAEAALISRASKMPKPQDPNVLKEECEPLVEASTDVSELKYDVNARSPLHNHVMAMGDAAAALGWVVAPAPLKHVRDYKNIVGNLAESILASYIELGCDPVHSDFAEALNAVMTVLVDYVNKEHPAGLRWNYTQGTKIEGYKRAERIVSPDAHPIGDFYKLIHGALTRYYTCSMEFGGPVLKQAEAIVGAYTELAKVIETASNKVRPAPSSLAAELRLLLMSVQHELTPLNSVMSSVPPSYKFQDHLNVIQEFVSVMQWCTSSLNKMSPVSFIIDVQGITNLYLDRLIAAHVGPPSPDETYVNGLHREWAQSVRDMLTELNEYVKDHHPTGLMFDTRQSRKSMDEINRKTCLSTSLQNLRNLSSSRKWKLTRAPKNVRGINRMIKTWRRV